MCQGVGHEIRMGFARVKGIGLRPDAGSQDTYLLPAMPALAKSQSVIALPSSIAKRSSTMGLGAGG